MFYNKMNSMMQEYKTIMESIIGILIIIFISTGSVCFSCEVELFSLINPGTISDPVLTDLIDVASQAAEVARHLGSQEKMEFHTSILEQKWRNLELMLKDAYPKWAVEQIDWQDQLNKFNRLLEKMKDLLEKRDGVAFDKELQVFFRSAIRLICCGPLPDSQKAIFNISIHYWSLQEACLERNAGNFLAEAKNLSDYLAAQNFSISSDSHAIPQMKEWADQIQKRFSSTPGSFSQEIFISFEMVKKNYIEFLFAIQSFQTSTTHQ